MQTDTTLACAVAGCTTVCTNSIDLAEHHRTDHRRPQRRHGTRLDRARFDRMRAAAAAAARVDETVCVGCPFRACPSCRWQGGVE